jgi:hypothetical protein
MGVVALVVSPLAVLATERKVSPLAEFLEPQGARTLLMVEAAN